MLCNLVTPRVLEWLRNGRPARILHLFDETCNLVNNENEVISLVSTRVGPGPFTMVLDNGFTAGLAVAQPVSVDKVQQRLMVGSSVVDFGATAVWQPKPDWSRLQNTAWQTPRQLPSDIHSYLEQVVGSIAANNVMACRAGAYALAGRGGGLTPTGDDVLMGVLYGLWVWQPCQEWMELVVDTAAPRTTTLSANFLRAAAAGEAVWQWHALVNGRPDALAHVLSIGHTSGADAWAGFVHTGRQLSPRMTTVSRIR